MADSLVVKYNAMLRKLALIRFFNEKESKEEDDFLDEMDKVWFKMTEKERAECNNSPKHRITKKGA